MGKVAGYNENYIINLVYRQSLHHCGANMSWRDITSTWLTNNSGKEDRLILDLIRYLVERNIIPETLVDNLTLHSILLTQIMLETLNGISVLKALQGNTFTYHTNAKEMMMWELGAKKNAKHIKSLEEQTGVNLDHYHKLGIMNM